MHQLKTFWRSGPNSEIWDVVISHFLSSFFHWKYKLWLQKGKKKYKKIHTRCERERGREKERIKRTESKVSRGRLSKCRLITAFPSLWTSFMFSNLETSSPPSVSFLSLSITGTSLNIQSSEPGGKNASRTWEAEFSNKSSWSSNLNYAEIPNSQQKITWETKPFL